MAAEEEVLGKAYDSRMMRRLMQYLGPYRLQVTLAMVAIILKAGADVLGPYLIEDGHRQISFVARRRTLFSGPMAEFAAAGWHCADQRHLSGRAAAGLHL